MHKIALHPLIKSKSGGEWHLYRIDGHAVFATNGPTGIKEAFLFLDFEHRLVKVNELAMPEFCTYYDDTFDKAILEDMPETLTVMVSEKPVKKNWITRLLRL